jgi:hypothetical protein
MASLCSLKYLRTWLIADECNYFTIDIGEIGGKYRLRQRARA